MMARRERTSELSTVSCFFSMKDHPNQQVHEDFTWHLSKNIESNLDKITCKDSKIFFAEKLPPIHHSDNDIFDFDKPQRQPLPSSKQSLFFLLPLIAKARYQ